MKKRKKKIELTLADIRRGMKLLLLNPDHEFIEGFIAYFGFYLNPKSPVMPEDLNSHEQYFFSMGLAAAHELLMDKYTFDIMKKQIVYSKTQQLIHNEDPVYDRMERLSKQINILTLPNKDLDPPDSDDDDFYLESVSDQEFKNDDYDDIMEELDFDSP